MKSLALLLALLLCASCGSEPKTSVLFVVVDTLRADHTSLYGYERETTPTLDALAAEGMWCERAYSPSSWTMPSMAQLMTGQMRSSNRGQIHSAQVPLAETFSAADYRTGAVVANPLLNAEQGFARGFDSFEIRRKNTPEGRRYGADSWPAPEVNRRALEFLDSVGDEPFFLWVHYFDPHDPYKPEDGIAFEPWDRDERRQAFRAALPVQERDALTDEVYAQLEERIALYDSEVKETDSALAELLAALEESGRAESTLVVFTSDHGEGLWQRAPLADEAYDKPNAYFPKLYFDHGIMLHEEQLRVPLVLRGPGVPAGSVREHTVSTIDLVPTVLARAGLSSFADLHGGDLCDDTPLARKELFAACSRSTSLTIDGRFRLHLPREHRLERGAQPELYDLASDPGELTPIEAPERLAAMRRALERWVQLFEDEGAAVPMSEAQRSILEDMGYTGGEADIGPPGAEGG